MLFYLKYFLFCARLMFNLKHYKQFLEYNPKRKKNYSIDLRRAEGKVKQDLKFKRVPQMDQAFLVMFYSTMASKNMKELSEEMEALFALSYMWWYSISKIENAEDEPCRE